VRCFNAPEMARSSNSTLPKRKMVRYGKGVRVGCAASTHRRWRVLRKAPCRRGRWCAVGRASGWGALLQRTGDGAFSEQHPAEEEDGALWEGRPGRVRCFNAPGMARYQNSILLKRKMVRCGKGVRVGCAASTYRGWCVLRTAPYRRSGCSNIGAFIPGKAPGCGATNSTLLKSRLLQRMPPALAKFA
jgi:hypothetical protein